MNARLKPGGFTLIELLVAAIMVGILTMALSRAFALGVTYPSRADASREREAARIRFEDEIRSLLATATVTSDTTDSSTYFLAGADAAGDDSRLTFTTTIPRLPSAQIESEDDFETQNQRFGPQGGIEEVSLGLAPVGQTDQSDGLFLREQRPADGDPTQGGYETVLDQEIASIQWEFFDGANWQTVWDSRTTQRRIPAAVRVTYQLSGEDDQRVFVVRLAKSDVTVDNPVAQASTAGGTGQ